MISLSSDPIDCLLGNVVIGRRRYFPVDITVSRASPSDPAIDGAPPYRLQVHASLPAQYRLEAVFGWGVNGAGTQSTSPDFNLAVGASHSIRAWFSIRPDSPAPALLPGSVEIRLMSGARVVANRSVAMSATVITAVPTNIVFALDRSQKMNDLLDGEPRTVRMRMAASTCLALLSEDDQAAAVTFNGTAASTVSFGALSSGPVNGFATRRLAMQDLLSVTTLHSSLVPSGSSSIAGAISQSQTVLDSVADKNVLVFTAGFEVNFLSLYNLPFVGEKRFAVAITEALGLANVAVMQTLVGTGGRYLVAVDNPTGNSGFLLQKYACQALLDTTGQQTVLDPDGALGEGESQTVEFDVTEADHGFDVLLLTEEPEALSLEIVPARGDRKAAGSDELPSEGARTSDSRHDDRWHGCGPRDDVRIEQRELRAHSLLGRRLSRLPDDRERRPQRLAVRIAGVQKGARSKSKARYALLITTQSDLTLNAQLHTDDLYVGAELLISATIQQSRHAPTEPARVEVELTYPDGGSERFSLPSTGPGRFEKSLKTFRPGPYRAHFVARGKSFFGVPYRRESMQTVVVLPESARLRQPQAR